MQDFTTGQRWISDSEPELGLGLLIEIEHRMITVEFPETGETRLYAKNNAPLSRISFNKGDEIHDRDNNAYTVIKVEDVDGLLIYQVQATAVQGHTELIALPETALCDAISLNQPLNRLLSGQLDHSHWFQLRCEALTALNFIEHSSLLGLCSARTELIPHQLYIANEVAKRYAPRVLLADEVGLGKTIEACLILQQQLFSGLASRILIIVPETLLHQWLVELLRRFNLAFSIFDIERCLAIAEDSGDNPFFTEQLILCSNELFIDSPELHAQALNAEWDLLIVDEAHHLKPSNTKIKEKTAENIAYQNIESFSKTVKGLLLLTATPDQLGRESHFALLRLLDSNRFHRFSEFVKEQDSFIAVANLVEQLEGLDLDSEGVNSLIHNISQQLDKLFKDANLNLLLAELNDEQSRQAVIDAIVDRHGTGRILFRNTRKIISGFPQRCLHAYPLPAPKIYGDFLFELQPEIHFSVATDWLKEDPRIQFTLELLLAHPQEKILLICAHKKTAMAIEEFLRLRKGIRSSVFHEDMSILERDRAAAYFAEIEAGAQILLCSEIGSEGRNFQFSHHLILFDLPINPDLLEQRIGRLDRIGQTQTINIHVPFIKDSAQEKLFNWYQEGLNAFDQTNPAAYIVFQQVHQQLEQYLFSADSSTPTLNHDFIKQTQSLNKDFLQELSLGRDRLLEINSFNAKASQTLINEITTLETQSSPKPFLTKVFDNFGIETEENSDQSWVVKAGEDMVIDSFPVIPDQGMTLTYQRKKALHREDVQFVSWHHPLIDQSIDLILQGDLGKSAIAILQDKRLKSGTILLESIYRIQVQAAKHLQLKRFLPTTSHRVLMDSQQRDISSLLDQQTLNNELQHVDKSHLMGLLNAHKTQINEISQASEQLVMKLLPSIISQSNEQMQSSLNDEIKRLTALQQINPNIRKDEIDFLKNQLASLQKAFKEATLQLDGLRLIFIA